MSMRKRHGFGLVYLFVAALVVLVAFFAYAAWWFHYREVHPKVVAAIPTVYAEEILSEGWLLWHEEILATPYAGKIVYSRPHEAHRVFKGEAVAVIDTGRERIRLASHKAGYFVPGLDGAEGAWRFSEIWLGSGSLKMKTAFKWFENGRALKRGDPIGKVVPMPQNLRCVAFVAATPDVQRSVESGRLSIKLMPKGLPLSTEVLASEELVGVYKVYLSLSPYFPPSVLTSRKLSFYVFVGERSGVEIPESSVVMRNGRQGVWVVEDGVTTFRDVHGMPISSSRFVVTEGLKAGEIVIEEGGKAKEGGRVLLW